MKSLSLVFLLLVTICNLLACVSEVNGQESCFVVTGHILNAKVEIGINQEFSEKAIPFINNVHPDFLVLTGDMIFGDYGRTPNRLPVETIKRKYDFLVNSVFSRIKTEIYCVAGNHDTGWFPHPPSIQLFKETLNPLYFSFEHKGSLFLFLSLYQPFPHLEMEKVYPLKSFDTPASRTLLSNLRSKFQEKHDHVFIFVHISPMNDLPIGYYWSQYLIPLLSSLGQDIYVFSTDHLTRKPLFYNTNRMVRYNNICFYCFSQFPDSTYIIHFDNQNVKVDLLQGSSFVPAAIQEVGFQPTTRLTMLRRYLHFRFKIMKYYYNELSQKVKHLFG